MKTSSVKHSNRSSILSQIMAHQFISRKQVAEVLGLAPAALSNLGDQLIRDTRGVDGGGGEASSKGGRRPISLTVNPDAGRILSVVFRLRNPQVAVCDMLGRILDSRSYEEQEFEGTSQMADTLFQDIRELIQNAGGASRFIGAGLSVPGIVQNGVVLNSPELGLENSDLAGRLEKAIGIPVSIDKDVYMNALGENWKGAGRKYSNFVTVSIGTGIGSAIIIDNHVYRGAGGMAGEIGYLSTSMDALSQGPFKYTDFGYFERCASVNRLREEMNMHFHQIAQQCMGGEKEILEKLYAQTDQLCLGLGSLISLINPEAVILTGAYGLVSELVRERIVRNLEYLTPIRCEISFSHLGSQIMVYGCVGTVLQRTYDITFLQKFCEEGE